MLAGFMFGIKLALILMCICVALAIALFIPFFVIVGLYLLPYFWHTCDKEDYKGLKTSIKEANKLYKSWISKEPTLQ